MSDILIWNWGHFAEHARSLVSMVKESSGVDQKSTMLQLVDLFRKSGNLVRFSLHVDSYNDLFNIFSRSLKF